MAQGAAPGASQESNRVPEDSVRQELSRVLSSHEFHSSKRSQDFIRYVVEHTLGGRTDLLKERTIGRVRSFLKAHVPMKAAAQ